MSNKEKKNNSPIDETIRQHVFITATTTIEQESKEKQETNAEVERINNNGKIKDVATTFPCKFQISKLK